MAVDAFLDLAFSGNPVKIYGESIDKTFATCFHVKSCSFTITQKSTVSVGTGAAGGKAEFEEFEFSIDTQLGSPALMQACAAGTMFPKVFLHARKASGGSGGSSQQTFLKYQFNDVLISSFATSVEEESADTVKLTYTGVVATYGKQLPDGTISSKADDQSKGGYDIKLNQVITDSKLTIGSGDKLGTK